MNDLAPKYLKAKFQKRSTIHTRHTRNMDELQIPLFKTAAGQRTFKYRGAKIWNNLNPILKQEPNIKNFKQRLEANLQKVFQESLQL